MKKKETGMKRDTYLSKNIGDFSDTITIGDRVYTKIEDLRYGTNPHQPAAFYKPEDAFTPIGDMKILKNGKNGLSQTNLEDISYAINIVKYFDTPACAVMKHVNPSGAAVQCGDETQKEVYIKARDCDARAAFGSAIAFNEEVTSETADEIMSSFTECVVAPSYSEKALEIFNDNESYKFNKHVRIIECTNIHSLPKFTGEGTLLNNTIKVLADGSLVIATPLTTTLKSVKDLQVAESENKRCGKQISEVKATDQQLEDILTAWYINLSVRSNGVVIVKDGQTLSVGTGEQDRVGAVEQAIWKFNNKYEGDLTLTDSVMASDGFFPFEDGVEVAANAGVKVIIAPAGSLRDADVIKRANELGIALIHAPERIFSHH